MSKHHLAIKRRYHDGQYLLSMENPEKKIAGLKILADLLSRFGKHTDPILGRAAEVFKRYKHLLEQEVVVEDSVDVTVKHISSYGKIVDASREKYFKESDVHSDDGVDLLSSDDFEEPVVVTANEGEDAEWDLVADGLSNSNFLTP